MKGAVLFSLIVALYAASAVPVKDGQEPLIRDPYPRFIQFPDGDGVMHDVDLEAEVDMDLVHEIARNPANNLYLLFTRRNPNNAQTLVMDDANSIRSSNFNPNVPTTVVVHGWLSNQETDINPVVTKACLDKSDVNVIVLDWRRLAGNLLYNVAVSGVPDVGRGLGRFLAFLHHVTGAPYNTMHLAGFSLGAHVVGNAGRELGGKVGRVTALDPAGPLWTYNSNRVNPNDGIYVEAIHTDGGYTVGGLGIGRDVADADFYPNGGISQPGCITNICNHNNAWRYFAATVTHNHLVARECSSSLQISLNNCSGQEFHMGNNELWKSGRGRYRVNTGRNYPY